MIGGKRIKMHYAHMGGQILNDRNSTVTKSIKPLLIIVVILECVPRVYKLGTPVRVDLNL